MHVPYSVIADMYSLDKPIHPPFSFDITQRIPTLLSRPVLQPSGSNPYWDKSIKSAILPPVSEISDIAGMVKLASGGWQSSVHYNKNILYNFYAIKNHEINCDKSTIEIYS